MNQSHHLTLFWVTLLTNAVTMIVTIIAASRRPTWGYRVIGVVAVCAFIAALHQVITAEFTLPALLLTGLLVLVIIVRVMLNLLALRKQGKG
jgi:hypothetical protein